MFLLNTAHSHKHGFARQALRDGAGVPSPRRACSAQLLAQGQLWGFDPNQILKPSGLDIEVRGWR